MSISPCLYFPVCGCSCVCKTPTSFLLLLRGKLVFVATVDIIVIAKHYQWARSYWFLLVLVVHIHNVPLPRCAKSMRWREGGHPMPRNRKTYQFLPRALNPRLSWKPWIAHSCEPLSIFCTFFSRFAFFLFRFCLYVSFDACKDDFVSFCYSSSSWTKYGLCFTLWGICESISPAQNNGYSALHNY